MLVFLKEKLVVLAVPKTGTTALATALAPHADILVNDPPELKHAPVYRYNRFFRPMFEKACGVENLDIMAVMREPISWLGSWYRYRQRDFLRGKPTSTAELSFDEFILGYLEDEKPAFARVGSQAKFLEPRPNGTKAKYIFRYETPQETIRFLEERLDITLDLGRENISPARTLELSPQIEAKLREKYAKDFALYAWLGIPK
ncbi:MAG: gamma-glutamyl kinase [Cognatishimia sp.]|uniref:gamma-glutamyl kinase n=1 Tax=Cognatishimia sp. TaxID=2211648 RepID=UPI00405A1683